MLFVCKLCWILTRKKKAVRISDVRERKRREGGVGGSFFLSLLGFLCACLTRECYKCVSFSHIEIYESHLQNNSYISYEMLLLMLLGRKILRIKSSIFHPSNHILTNLVWGWDLGGKGRRIMLFYFVICTLLHVSPLSPTLDLKYFRQNK